VTKTSIRAALLDHLPKDAILDRFEKGKGDELHSGKLGSPASSALLAANTFGLFLTEPELLTLPKPPVSAGSARSVYLEAEMRFPWRGGLHPWLDVVVETDEALIGIESKRYEPFRDKKIVSFSPAYQRRVWGTKMGPFETMRASLEAGERAFDFLDAAQLVRHAFGLRTQATKREKSAHLLYLYAEPKDYPIGALIPEDHITRHRAEVAQFAADVGGAEVGFSSLTYADLLESWRVSQHGRVRAHAAAVLERFDLQRNSERT